MVVIADPGGSALIGIVAFHERITFHPIAAVVEVASVAVIVLCVFTLTRSGVDSGWTNRIRPLLAALQIIELDAVTISLGRSGQAVLDAARVQAREVGRVVRAAAFVAVVLASVSTVLGPMAPRALRSQGPYLAVPRRPTWWPLVTTDPGSGLSRCPGLLLGVHHCEVDCV